MVRATKREFCPLSGENSRCIVGRRNREYTGESGPRLVDQAESALHWTGRGFPEREVERAPRPGLGLHPNSSPVPLNDLFADGQADADAIVLDGEVPDGRAGGILS